MFPISALPGLDPAWPQLGRLLLTVSYVAAIATALRISYTGPFSQNDIKIQICSVLRAGQLVYVLKKIMFSRS